MKCEKCGTVDERGPHTDSNCIGVLQHRVATLEANYRLSREQHAADLDQAIAAIQGLEAKLKTATEALFDITNLKYTEADPVDRMFDIAKRLARNAHDALGTERKE